MSRRWLFAIAAASSFPGAALAQSRPIEIRFCPSAEVRVYPLESRQEIQSVVLQQVAILNRSSVPVEVTGVDLELLQGGRAVETRRLTLPELRKAAQIGVVAPPPGASRVIACQFWDGRAIGLESRAALGRGDALVVSRQLLAFHGARDALRVRVRARAGGRPVEASRQLPVRMAMSATTFRFPLRGTWWVGAGATPYSHHRWVASEEFALDIGKLGEGGLDHRGAGLRFRDYHGYGAEVVAAADGVVVAAVDGIAEDARFMRRAGESMSAYARRIREIQAANVSRGMAAVAGNHVILDHGRGEYSLYAHLQPRSVRLRPGARVKQGQPIGRLGSSGNSAGPHLHFQVCDRPDPFDCASIPIRFQGIDLPWGDFPRPVQSGDLVVAP